jgi:iron-sulfur cluster assembly protein
MVLDEPADEDERYDLDGVTYIVDKKLLETIQPIHVDFVTRGNMSGFIVNSGLQAGGACGSCSSC